ncbi:MAG TPA: DUF2269 family protein [Thermoanaerobaculia bacterium]|nr:DUF2269 family protein [Thermoanaerobaculia bacterium]
MKPWLMFIPWMWISHLLGAVWLTAGVLAGTVISSQLKRTDGDPAGRVFGLRLAWRLMVVFVVPGVLLTGALGFYLVTVNPAGTGFNPGWVKLSIALYAVLLASTLLVQVPQIRKAVRAAEAGQVEPIKLAGILNHVNATIILVMILLMAFRPF